MGGMKRNKCLFMFIFFLLGYLRFYIRG
jgi:hypothetical protein